MGRGSGGGGGGRRGGGTATGATAGAAPRTPTPGIFGAGVRGVGRGAGSGVVRNRAGVAQRGSLADANNELRLRYADRLSTSRASATRTIRGVAPSTRAQRQEASQWVSGYRAAFTTGRMANSASVAFRQGERQARTDLANY